MALEYTINIYEEDPDDATKTMVTFVVKDKIEDKTFAVTKRITTGSKTKEAILGEAYDESQSAVAEWRETLTTVGKTWNPDSGSIS